MGPVPTLLIDSDGQLIAADRLAEAFLGFDDITDLRFTDLFNESRHIAELHTGKINQCEATMVVSGSRVSLSSVAMNALDGLHYVVSVLSVTDSQRKLAARNQQDYLPISSAQTHASESSQECPASKIDLAEYSPHGLVLLNEKFEFETANTAFFSITGLSSIESHGRGWLAALPLDTSQELAKSVGSADWNSTDEIEKEC